MLLVLVMEVQTHLETLGRYAVVTLVFVKVLLSSAVAQHLVIAALNLSSRSYYSILLLIIYMNLFLVQFTYTWILLWIILLLLLLLPPRRW